MTTSAAKSERPRTVTCWRCGGEIPPGAKFDLIYAQGQNIVVHPAGGCPR